MLKFLIILVLLIYTFYKVASFLFKIVFGGVQRNEFRSYDHQSKQTNGKVNVDRAPSKRKKDGGYQGGEYVDFEEVK